MEKLNASVTSVPARLAVLASSWLPTVIVSTADAATRSMFPRLNRVYKGMNSVFGNWGEGEKTFFFVVDRRYLLHMGAVGAGTSNLSKKTGNRKLHKIRFTHYVYMFSYLFLLQARRVYSDNICSNLVSTVAETSSNLGFPFIVYNTE